MPLYPLWKLEPYREILFFGIRGTVGDITIGSSALLVSLLFFGKTDRPRERFFVGALTTVSPGLAYSVWRQWYNIYILESWAHSRWMSIESGIGIGLSPLARWAVIPTLCLWWIGRRSSPVKAEQP